MINLESTTYVADPSEEGATGVSGTRYFVYSVRKSGTVKLDFVYARTWELNTILTAKGGIDYAKAQNSGIVYNEKFA